MAVSGEFKYFGPDFSSVARVRPVNAMTFPASLAMGNITRLRNLEYMAESFVLLLASSFGSDSGSLDSGGPLESERPASTRDDRGTVSSCFHENNPLSRNTSSLNSPFNRSRSRNPESGA